MPRNALLGAWRGYEPKVEVAGFRSECAQRRDGNRMGVRVQDVVSLAQPAVAGYWFRRAGNALPPQVLKVMVGELDSLNGAPKLISPSP